MQERERKRERNEKRKNRYILRDDDCVSCVACYRLKRRLLSNDTPIQSFIFLEGLCLPIVGDDHEVENRSTPRKLFL